MYLFDNVARAFIFPKWILKLINVNDDGTDSIPLFPSKPADELSNFLDRIIQRDLISVSTKWEIPQSHQKP
jgi:hypothetical protein